MKKPIVYESLIDVRFSDLDLYGHVNSKHYLDFVSTSRLAFMREKLNMSMEQVTANGIGVYLTKSTFQYRKAIREVAKLRIKSHVSKVRDERCLVIPFSIETADGDKVFADGELEFAIIDLKTIRTIPITPWLERLFFTCDTTDSDI